MSDSLPADLVTCCRLGHCGSPLWSSLFEILVRDHIRACDGSSTE